MKLANFSIGLCTSFLLALGVSYQVKAHEGSHPSTGTKGNLTEPNKDKLVKQFLQGIPEIPITTTDINTISQQFYNRFNLKDDLNRPNLFILPEDIKLPATTPGEWIAAPGGDAFQFNITAAPLSKLDQPITNTINTSKYDTPFSAAIAFIPPGTGGPTPHIHWWEDEWYWILKGKLDWYAGNNMYESGDIPGVNAPLENQFSHVELHTGELAYSHENHVHAYQNNSEETSILIHFWRRLENTDGGIEQFFLDKEVGRLVENPTDALPPNNVIDINWAAKWIEKFPKYGASASTFFDEYLTENAVIEEMDWGKIKDNHYEDLIALLRQVPELRREIPEPSIILSLLAFGSFSVILKFNKKNKF